MLLRNVPRSLRLWDPVRVQGIFNSPKIFDFQFHTYLNNSFTAKAGAQITFVNWASRSFTSIKTAISGNQRARPSI